MIRKLTKSYPQDLRTAADYLRIDGYSLDADEADRIASCLRALARRMEHDPQTHQTQALLYEMADNRNCEDSCRCAFCREFWMGVEAGRRDAAIELKGELDKLQRCLDAGIFGPKGEMR